MTPSELFDSERYRNIIEQADRKARAGFAIYSNKPRIAGTFSNWCSKEMMRLEDY
jgi:hypothetical protein